jgi:hypothetical protein
VSRGAVIARKLALVAVISIAACAGVSAQVPLVLHHLSVGIDSSTWHDMMISPLLTKQFAAVDSAHGVMTFLGKYSSLTLTRGGDKDRVVIMLTDEHASGFESLARAMGAATGDASALVGSGLEDPSSGAVATVGGMQTLFGVWQYSDALQPENRSMRRFLAARFDSTRFLARVSGATIAIPVEDIQKIVAALRADSVAMTLEGDGAKIALSGFDLHLVPPYGGAGIKQLKFALTHPAFGDPIYKFGLRSRLRFGPDAIATWDF